MKSLEDILGELPRHRQEKIKARAKVIVAEDRKAILQNLRESRDLTQAQLSNILNKDQSAISKLETRTDLKLSTLNAYATALGGTLKILVEFPDEEEAADLSGLCRDDKQFIS